MKEVDALERIGLVSVLAGLFVSLAMFLSYVMLPAERWLDVEALSVRNARVGSMPIVEFDRTIHRDFDGEWRTMVRRAERGGWVVACASDWRPNSYRTDARLPYPVTLGWFIWDDECASTLPAGLYRLEAEWIINVGSWFERDVHRDGILFEVSE